MRAPRGRDRRFVAATLIIMVIGGACVIAAPAAAAAEDEAGTVGSWSAPFEEGGVGTPRCQTVPSDTPGDPKDRLLCKPTAVTAAVLPNGKVLYGMGIESEENAEEGVLISLSTEARDSRTRVLDLTDGSPSWSIPGNETSDGVNPLIREGRTSDDCVTESPTEVLGVPGRPGDGPAGSVSGMLGGPSAEPTCSPDDVADNDGDIFCGDIATMADGRALLVGGTDWYNEPSVLERADGDPANVGLVELEGLRSARVFDWQDERWDATAPMKFGRWYPSLVTLPDGKMLVVSGTRRTRGCSWHPTASRSTPRPDRCSGPPGRPSTRRCSACRVSSTPRTSSGSRPG